MKETLRPTGGHILDIDSLEVGGQFLSLAHNVDMRRGFPTRRKGNRSAYADLPTDPLHALNFFLIQNWWLVFGATDIYALESGSAHDISIASQGTVADPHEWSSTLLNTIPVFTNGVDAPNYWTGDAGDNAIELPDWPADTLCKFIVAFRFHLFALNISDSGGQSENKIMWSDATEPGSVPDSWTAVPGNEAGSLFLADTEGRCIAGRPLGTQLMIYKPSSIYAVEYAGQQPVNIFTQRPVVRSVGLIAPHCIQTLKTMHAIVGNDDVVLTDGIRVDSIADNRVKLAIANSIDAASKLNVFTAYDKNRKELWVCLPEPGEQFCTVAHIWDQSRDAWITRDLFRTRYGTTGFVTDQEPSQIWDDDAEVWDADTTTWNEQPTGATEKVVTFEEELMLEEDVEPTAPVLGLLQKLDLSFGDSDIRKKTQRVWIEGAGVGLVALSFRLGYRNSTDEPIQWGASRLRASGGTPYEVSGRFISIEIFNNTTVDEWRVTRIIITADPDGEF